MYRIHPILHTPLKLLLLETFVICSCYALQGHLNQSDSIASGILPLKNFGELLVKTYGYERQLDVFKLEDGSRVYVVDKVLLPPQNSSLENIKIMRLAKVKNGVSSYVALDLPQQLTEKSIDTSQWKLNRMTHQIYGYHYMMIEALFLSDLIEFSDKCKANILSIGLGGGTVNGFLHDLFPHMNITVVEISQEMVKMARKWFGLVENNYQRVVVADGVKFIAEAATEGALYDAVLLDACSSEQMEGIVCPLDTFLNGSVLRDIVALLPKQGLLIVNAHAERMEIDKAYAFLINKFKDFFEYCDRLHNSILTENNVIYCSQQTPARKNPIDIPQLFRRLLAKNISRWRKIVP
ncbi:unnamed protein product [Cylicocyclus nassatus]|uniref:Methyltransferase-like protein 13 n=1 Tax=Cylicocyclus nassatus TaxID=53992 RepID=A0AA36GMU1_CYLNA|nr:unnamed protein product [Cylicocyclus nassatus]